MNNFLNRFEKYEFSKFGWVRLPEIKIENAVKKKFGVDEKLTNFEFLKILVKQGFLDKQETFKKERLVEYEDRLNFELNILEELGFVDYFLLVWMVINKARDLGCFIDFGRGSAAASLIFYLIGVTGVDPIEKKLIFQRFISKVRAKKATFEGVDYIWGDLAPDCDLNLGGVREQIVSWLRQLYDGKICKIATISTLTGKILVKDVYKTLLEVSEDEAKRIADFIEKHFGIVEDIEKMPEKNKDFKKWAETYPEVFETALKLRNLIRQKGCHASGYFLTYEPLASFVPLEFNKDKELTISYEMSDVAQLGIKLDLLGLTSNEIIKDVFENIDEKLENIELDNNSIVYDQFQHGKLLPYGLYQISADCAYRVLQDIKPRNIFELSDVNAIARPGALAYLKGYVENKSQCPHPIFEEILKPTRYYCLYQEQMIQMAVALGFTLEESELLRRIVGKKKVDEVKEWKERIYNKVKAKGLKTEIGDLFWKILDDSSKYSFNASHSLATSYLTALTVYLKYKHPLQFYTACLRAVKKLPNPIEEVSKIQAELHCFGIKLLPPHILKSELDFSIDGNNIRYGLGQVKGIAEKNIEKLNNFKHEYSNKFEIFQAANEAKISISILSSLILVGALDPESKGGSRSKIVLEAQLWNLLFDREKAAALEVGPKFNFDLIQVVKYLNKEAKNEKGQPIIKDSRLDTIRKHFLPYKEIYDQNRKNEKLIAYVHENLLLGYSYSIKLIDVYSEFADDLINISDVIDTEEDRRAHFVGKVLETKSGTAKNEKKTKYFRCSVQDETGTINVMLFNDRIEQHEEENNKRAEEGDIVVVRGRKKGDSIFADVIGIQDVAIVLKKNELKKIKEEKPKSIIEEALKAEYAATN